MKAILCWRQRFSPLPDDFGLPSGAQPIYDKLMVHYPLSSSLDAVLAFSETLGISTPEDIPNFVKFSEMGPTGEFRLTTGFNLNSDWHSRS